MSVHVLVVDNEKPIAEAHADAMRVATDHDCDVFIADSPEEATKVLAYAPSFDAVICDLSFDDADGVPNVHGTKVGEWMKKRGYPAISFLCTAKFNEQDGEFLHSARYFDETLPTGARALHYKEIAEKARENKLNRLKESELAVSPSLASTHEKGLKHIHTFVDNTATDEAGRYFEQGYEIISAQPVVSGFAVGSPIFIWIRTLQNGIYLEVYGQPRLLAFGDDLEDGLRSLNEVLWTTYVDIMGEGVFSGPMEFIAKFLRAVYDDSFGRYTDEV